MQAHNINPLKITIMTVKELIIELQSIIEAEPHKADVDVFVYPVEDIEMECPNEIAMVDGSISDRVDINI